jgi:hypothetical protein
MADYGKEFSGKFYNYRPLPGVYDIRRAAAKACGPSGTTDTVKGRRDLFPTATNNNNLVGPVGFEPTTKGL